MERNLSLYYIFYMVAENENISYAAKQLYISQPAVSKAIQKLEDNFNTKLFERSSRGVLLTESGKILYEAAKKAFDCFWEAENKIKRIKNMEEGQLRIGASTTVCKYLLLPKLEQFIKQYPNIKITISCQSSFQTVRMLEENKLDMGFVGAVKKHKDIRFYPILHIQDVFVASPAYLERINKDCYIEKKYLQNANIMLLEEENISRKYVEEYFKKYHISINQILEVGTMDLLIEFAKMGLGIACVIQQFVQEELKDGVLSQLPLEIEMEQREIGFAYCTNMPITQAVKQFLQETKLLE